MDMSAAAAAWLLIPAAPIGLWVAWTDLSEMKIRNSAVLALLVGYAVIGFFVLPLDAYLWRYVNLVVILVLGMLANSIGLLGAGDAKFAAAAAPYIAVGDLVPLFGIYCGALIFSYILHRTARRTAVRRMFPTWESWSSGKRFPMGFPLAITLIGYLVVAAFRGAAA